MPTADDMERAFGNGKRAGRKEVLDEILVMMAGMGYPTPEKGFRNSGDLQSHLEMGLCGKRPEAALKEKAEAELKTYVYALTEVYDTHCMSLFEGMVAGFCATGTLTSEEGNNWLCQVRKIVRK